jgi:carbon-monoxide dehydrogenase medium subunit
MWQEYIIADSVQTVIDELGKDPSHTKLIAGGTDLLLEIEQGIRKDITRLIDISRLQDFNSLWLDDQSVIHLSGGVTHSQVVASKTIHDLAFPLWQACSQIGSPQIRNRGTLVGNIVTGSPANDTITPLAALNAEIVCQSGSGKRIIPIADFYQGVRKTVLTESEIVTEIRFPAMKPDTQGSFVKFALRKAQAISVVNSAMIITVREGVIKSAVVTLGAVSPTIIHAKEAEAFLIGKNLSSEITEMASRLIEQSARPIDDIRGSARFRQEIVRVTTRRAMEDLFLWENHNNFQKPPVLDDNRQKKVQLKKINNEASSIVTTRVNGKDYQIDKRIHGTLLSMLRDGIGLIGTKEGCTEGECGACTVFLDGAAVMSCLVPAARAEGAEIITIEGIQDGKKLHPVQQSFILENAVQCGYCTPGFIMAGVKLLEENSNPTEYDIKQAISGNLCRCTGYYNIIRAIGRASEVINE